MKFGGTKEYFGAGPIRREISRYRSRSWLSDARERSASIRSLAFGTSRGSAVGIVRNSSMSSISFWLSIGRSWCSLRAIKHGWQVPGLRVPPAWGCRPFGQPEVFPAHTYDCMMAHKTALVNNKSCRLPTHFGWEARQFERIPISVEAAGLRL